MLGFNCPRCDSNEIIKNGIDKQSRNQRIYTCKICRKYFYHPEDYRRGYNLLNKIPNILSYYNLFLKKRHLHNEFWEWINHRKDLEKNLKTNKKSYTDIIIFFQSTNVSFLRGRILYLAVKTPFEERFFFDKKEKIILKEFLSFLKKQKSYRIITFSKQDFLGYLIARCQKCRVAIPNFQTKSSKFKGIVCLKEMLEKSGKLNPKKLNTLTRNFNLVPTNIKNIPDDEKIYELLFQKTNYLKKNPQFGETQIDLLTKDETYRNLVSFILNEVRTLFEVYYLLKIGEIL